MPLREKRERERGREEERERNAETLEGFLCASSRKKRETLLPWPRSVHRRNEIEFSTRIHGVHRSWSIADRDFVSSFLAIVSFILKIFCKLDIIFSRVNLMKLENLYLIKNKEIKKSKKCKIK